MMDSSVQVLGHHLPLLLQLHLQLELDVQRFEKALKFIPPLNAPSTGNVKFPYREMSFSVPTFLALDRSIVNFLQDAFFIVCKKKN